MNVNLDFEDSSWQAFLAALKNALKSSDTLLKKAFLVIWPREESRIFQEEMGPDGPWAPWKDSTKRQRMVHELRSAIGKAHSSGSLTYSQRARAESKVRGRQAALYAGGTSVRRGGKLLQVSGRLRTQSIQNPIVKDLGGGLEVQSPTPYSGYLDEGTKRMEARPFMWLGDDAQDNMMQVLADSIWQQSGGDE